MDNNSPERPPNSDAGQPVQARDEQAEPQAPVGPATSDRPAGPPDAPSVSPQYRPPAYTGQAPSGQHIPPLQATLPPVWRPAIAIPGGVVRDGIVYAPAGFLPRFYAFLLDGIVLGLLGQLLVMLAHLDVPDPSQSMKVMLEFATAMMSSGQASEGLLARLEAIDASLNLIGWLNIGLCASYFTIAHGMFGTTPGKMVLGLRVLRRDGSDLGIPLALLRYLGYLICSRLIYTAWLIPLNPERRTAYDMLLRTNVFRALGPLVTPPPPAPDQYYGQS